MVFYLIPAALVFSIALQAFLEDKSTANTHFDSWVLLVIAAMLWPITLPAIVNHRLSEASGDGKGGYPAAPVSTSLGGTSPALRRRKRQNPSLARSQKWAANVRNYAVK